MGWSGIVYPEPRTCTCHPSEAPRPCAKQYAFSECLSVHNRRWLWQRAAFWEGFTKGLAWPLLLFKQ